MSHLIKIYAVSAIFVSGSLELMPFALILSTNQSLFKCIHISDVCTLPFR